MVTSLYKWKILQRDVEQYIINHIKRNMSKNCYKIKPRLKETSCVFQPFIQIYWWRPINKKWLLSQLCPLDISRWARNKGHHRIWQICYMYICIPYLILTPNVDWQLHYMTNVQSSNFLFYVVIYHIHLLMLQTHFIWFDTHEHVLHMRTFQKEANNWQKSWCWRFIMNLV
jgi:hypothetical protein